MKRFRMFLVMISAVLFSGVLSSCSKDDDFEGNLAGTWYSGNATLTLESDGQGDITYDYGYGNDKEIVEFSWDATGDIISFTYQEEMNDREYPDNRSYKYIIADDYLILTDFDGAKEEVWSRYSF